MKKRVDIGDGFDTESSKTKKLKSGIFPYL